MVFQDFAQLFPWRTALGNVAFGLEMKGIGKEEREKIARKQLSLVKLDKFANSYPHHLSGGMQQRVAIARALFLADAFHLPVRMKRPSAVRHGAKSWNTTPRSMPWPVTACRRYIRSPR